MHINQYTFYNIGPLELNATPFFKPKKSRVCVNASVKTNTGIIP